MRKLILNYLNNGSEVLKCKIVKNINDAADNMVHDFNIWTDEIIEQYVILLVI